METYAISARCVSTQKSPFNRMEKIKGILRSEKMNEEKGVEFTPFELSLSQGLSHSIKPKNSKEFAYTLALALAMYGA